jgi:predicted regulator of Ras-like GTPase activity (Roadblock/LC7/MglB family)
MKDNNLKVELERIVNDLGKVEGVEGAIIVDNNEEILSQRIIQDVDISLFGPMAHVITSSSKRLLSSSNQGNIQRVLVESGNGKALFLDLGNLHFVVLMENRANVGLIMVSSKRAAEKIKELTKDLKLKIRSEEKIQEQFEVKKKIVEEEPVEVVADLLSQKIEVDEVPDLKIASEVNIKPPISVDETEENSHAKLALSEIEVEKEPVKEGEKPETFSVQEKLGSEIKTGKTIPVIQPPIAFPEIKKVIEMPENVEERAELILDIYEAIFRAMSIGASKIMGVAPARGLTQKFLPLEHCKKLLDGVNVKSNSTIDFVKIRENANKIPVEERESQFTADFTRIIDVVTENYGKVMGYGAFRGMVRPEFKIIADSYGPIMKKLGITDKMHSEMVELFE